MQEEVFLVQEFQILSGGALELEGTIYVGLGSGEKCETFLLMSLDDHHPC